MTDYKKTMLKAKIKEVLLTIYLILCGFALLYIAMYIMTK